MKHAAVRLAFLAIALPVAAYATNNTNLYSESITRQLDSAEVPKSFEASGRAPSAEAAVKPTSLADYRVTTPSADSSLESALDADSIDTDGYDKPAEIIKAAGKNSPKKSAKRAKR